MKVKTSPDEKPKKRGGIQPRNRTKYSAAQLHAMESLFLNSQYPDSFSIDTLGKSIGVSADRISIWFQNRRSKFKRQSKDVHMAWMRKQIFNQSSQQQQTSILGLPRLPVHTQSPPDNRHVLSRVEEPQSPVLTTQEPSSLISYLPTTNSLSSQLNNNVTDSAAQQTSQCFTSSGYQTPSPQTSSLASYLPHGNESLYQSSSGYPCYNYGENYNNYINTNQETYIGNYSYYYNQMNNYYPLNSHQMYPSQYQQPMGV